MPCKMYIHQLDALWREDGGCSFRLSARLKLLSPAWILGGLLPGTTLISWCQEWEGRRELQELRAGLAGLAMVHSPSLDSSFGKPSRHPLFQLGGFV